MEKATHVRWWILGLGLVGFSISNVDRANLAVVAPTIGRELHIEPALMGLVLSAFFWTYAASQFISGILVDRFGVRAVFAISAALWSIATATTGLVSGFVGLIALRLILGVAESPAYPSATKVISEWFPRRERALATGLIMAGPQSGAFVALLVVPWLEVQWGWRGAFFVCGTLGLIWAAAWFLIYRPADRHPWPNRAEIRYVEADQEETLEETTRVPWRSFFRHRTVWGMMLGFFCYNFNVYFFVTWFPSYLLDARRFSSSQVWLGSLPSLVALVSGCAGGILADGLYRKGWELTRVRKTCIVGGFLVAAVISVTPLVPNGWVIPVLSLAYAGLALGNPNINALAVDVAPTRGSVASLSAIQNFAAQSAGVVTANCTGLLVQWTGSYNLPLLIAGMVCLVGAAAYGLVVGKVEPLSISERATVTPAALKAVVPTSSSA